MHKYGSNLHLDLIRVYMSKEFIERPYSWSLISVGFIAKFFFSIISLMLFICLLSYSFLRVNRSWQVYSSHYKLRRLLSNSTVPS